MLEKKCRFCGATIDKEADICPICGRELKVVKSNNVSFIIVFITISLFILFPITIFKNLKLEDNKDNIKVDFNNTIKDEVTDKDIKDDEIDEDVIDEDISNDEINEDIQEDNPLTNPQTEAIEYAKRNLKIFSSSRKEIINLLKLKGYSEEIAIFAADNCDADWNIQALNSAKSYLSHTAFSYKGLISQLEFEGFTSEQAKYGVDNCNANWNEQASKKAKTYLKYFDYTKEELIKQLEYEGFTHEQAVYGVNQNNY